MPDEYPSTNGHSPAPSQIEPTGTGPGGPPRGRWIAVGAVVSATAGGLLLAGGVAGGIIAAAIASHGRKAVPLVLACAGAGGVGGVWIGCRLAIGLTAGGDSRVRLAAARIGGLAGFVGAVGLEAAGRAQALRLLRLMAPLMPGIGSALGDALASRRSTAGEAEEGE